MDTIKIRAIEDALDQLENCNKYDYDQKTEAFLFTICDYLNISLSANPVSSLFNGRTSTRQKEFIAACLLRALSRKPDILWETETTNLRIKVCDLFDQALGDIYKRIGISIEDKIEVKLSRLQDIEKDLIKEFRKLHSFILNKYEYKAVKSNFMSLLFGVPQNYLIISQFIDKSLIEKDKISSLFEQLENYAEASSVESVVEAHRKTTEHYVMYVEEIKNSSCNLTWICIGKLFEIILRTVQDDFSSREELVPTEVEAKVLDRKYPFHIEHREINIELRTSNKGKGKAFDVEVSIQYDERFLQITNSTIKIGSLDPGEIRDIYFRAVTQKSMETAKPEVVLGSVAWSDYSGKNNFCDFEGELLPQDPHLDWQEMSKSKPYNLEAISEERELAGRGELIKQLYAKLVSNQLESSIIFGQKRVGKTSIAKTIQKKLKHLQDYTAIYLSVGSLDKSTPEKCLNSLGEYIHDEIFYEPALNGLKLPELKFEGSITPLDRFFKIIRRLKPEHNFVIIIDEFDEIPSQLYQITSIGDNFFHNIRSLSSESNIGFILVGGENMKIINQSTDKLNKFETFPVDYFDRGKYWNDFQDPTFRRLTND